MDILIINPWIFDFAAFDMWARPLGLLQIATCLRNHGYSVSFLDCLDTFHPMVQESAKRPKAKAFGTSKYYKEEIEKPLQYAHIPRRYSRYGLPPHIVKEQLLSLSKPKAILVGSMMTYWYLGVQSTISLVKEVFKGVPIILGGIYARLCTEHARRFSGAHYVISSHSGLEVLRLLKSLHITGSEGQPLYPYPSYDLLTRRDVVGLMTTEGCPFNCSYCASPFLYPSFSIRPAEEVVSQVRFWSEEFGVRDFAFYDDALLMRPDIQRLLDSLGELPYEIRFHTPNALHAKRITKEIAKLLLGAGFKTIR
ncbi:MAG: B12-binding domain-containing radical SAM protein [Desulfatiglandales bacterium]